LSPSPKSQEQRAWSLKKRHSASRLAGITQKKPSCSGEARWLLLCY
jgi:hypothetical protein